MTTDTTTPRAVLAHALEAARIYGAEGANAEDLDIPCDNPYTENDEDTLALERDYLAALAASAGPLSAEELAEMSAAPYVGPLTFPKLQMKWFTAYTALAADLAALRATVAEYDSIRDEIRFCADSTEANSQIEAYEHDGVDYKDIDGHIARDRRVVEAIRAVLERTGSPEPLPPTPEGQG